MCHPTSTAKLTRLHLLFHLLCSPIWAFAAVNDGGLCEPIVDKSGDDWTIAIWNSGRYCIGQDLNQSTPIFRFPHQAVPKDPLLIIEKGHVFADLNRHLLITSVHTRVGMRVYALKKSPIDSVTVQNGSITSTSGPAVFMVDAFDDAKDTRFGQNLAIAFSQGNISRYRTTEFVLEGLTLKADDHVIIMQGMKNIIRHCKIIGGNSTVNLFGPELVFEDNEIILHAKSQADAGDEAAVTIYLEDAANSIIRNNRITIKGRTVKSKAIVIKNSSNVTVEGNTVSGADSLYQLLDDRSSVTENHNILMR